MSVQPVQPPYKAGGHSSSTMRNSTNGRPHSYNNNYFKNGPNRLPWYWRVVIIIIAIIIAAVVIILIVFLLFLKTTSTTTTTTTSTNPTTTSTTSTTTSTTTTSTTSTTTSTSTTSTTSTSTTSTTSTTTSTTTTSTTTSTTSTTTSTSTTSTTSTTTSTTTTSTTSTTTSTTTTSTTSTTSSTSTTSTTSTSTASTTSATTSTTTTSTTTSPVVTVTITSNICTMNWTGIQMIAQCVNNCPGYAAYGIDMYSYVATGTTGVIVFGAQRQAAFFALDDVSITSMAAPSVQLITNGGFETGNLTGWSYCNQNNVASTGGVKTSGFTFNGYTYSPHSGSYYYLIGDTSSMDYLSQSFPTVVGQVYNVTFWFQLTLGGPNVSGALFLGT